MSERPTAVDLFCGAGGASCGIDDAGFEIVAAVDQNTDALNTHAENLPGYTISHDLSDVDPSVLPERARSSPQSAQYASTPTASARSSQCRSTSSPVRRTGWRSRRRLWVIKPICGRWRDD